MTRRTLFSTIPAAIGAALMPTKAPAKTAQVAVAPDFTEAEYEKAITFINGDQWPAELRAHREAAGRPALVFNRVLPIFQQKVCERGVSSGRFVSFGSRAWREIAVDVYRKTADSQRMYNYYRSAELEALRMQNQFGADKICLNSAITATCEMLALELSA